MFFESSNDWKFLSAIIQSFKSIKNLCILFALLLGSQSCHKLRFMPSWLICISCSTSMLLGEKKVHAAKRKHNSRLKLVYCRHARLQFCEQIYALITMLCRKLSKLMVIYNQHALEHKVGGRTLKCMYSLDFTSQGPSPNPILQSMLIVYNNQLWEFPAQHGK